MRYLIACYYVFPWCAFVDSDLVYDIIGIIFLLVIAGCFSASETAISAFSSSRIHRLKSRGNKAAVVADGFTNKRSILVSAMLIGNTIANVLCTSVSTIFFVEMLGNEKGLLVSSFVMMFCVLFFAEILPKSYAVKDPEHCVLRFSSFVRITNMFLMPVTILIDRLVSLIFKLFNVQSKTVLAASDVMRDMIAMHASQGTMLKDDLDMLESILDLANTEISKVMTPRNNVFSLSLNIEREEFVRCILNSPHSRIPIWEGDQENIVGVIHVKDLVEEINSLNNRLDLLDLHKVMMPPWFVPETTLLSMQLHSFKKAKMHFAFVIDEYGTIQGIVTLEDILEEIVGNISDEHDLPEESFVEKVSDEVYRIRGFASVRDINRSLDWELPEEAHTLAGIIIKALGKIPDEGEEVIVGHFKFKILERKQNTICNVEVSVLENVE